MAATSPSLNQHCQLEKHLQCSICKGVFNNPVTTPCGHSFCKQCLYCHMVYGDGACPVCKRFLNNFPDVNIALRDVVQQLTKTPEDAYTGAPDEVACDICTEQKLKAKKSCLMCLQSYCSTHLEFHRSTERLKGHKLVAPVTTLDLRACLKHGRTLELYSRNQQRCICVRCLEDDRHMVVSTEAEWKTKLDELGNTTAEMQQEIDQRKTKMDEIYTDLQDCKDKLEKDWWDIDAVMTAVMAIVEEAQEVLLQPLTRKRRGVETEAEHLKRKLVEETNDTETALSEMKYTAGLDDHILFLQSYPPLQNSGCETDWTEVKLDTSLSFGTMRTTTTKMMKKIEEELEKLTAIELKRVSVFTEDVKLDPMSAHRRLVVSQDGKQVKDGGEDQEADDNPKRFNLFGSIVGLKSFSSGRAYWEVDVSNKTGWDLGVIRGDANRKGKPRANPDNGYWVIAQYEHKKYTALTVPPLRLCLEDKLEKVGVFVDYREGLVSFYNVTAQSHIYSFTECTFRNGLYPYFGPHVKQDETNSEPLIISAL